MAIPTGWDGTVGAGLGAGGCKDGWENDLAVKVLKPKGSYEEIRDAARSEFIKLTELRNPYITFVFDAFEYQNKAKLLRHY